MILVSKGIKALFAMHKKAVTRPTSISTMRTMRNIGDNFPDPKDEERYVCLLMYVHTSPPKKAAWRLRASIFLSVTAIRIIIISKLLSVWKNGE